jgi:hypothetical protein
MIDHSKDIADFNARIAAMGERLARLGVGIVHMEYCAELVGSWHIIAGDSKKRLNFRYDGKDSYLMFRDAAITDNDSRDWHQKAFKTWEGEDPLVYIEDVLAREFST